MKAEERVFKDEFSALQLDVLKEVGNIGAGNAAASLSTLLNKPINMSVPSIQVIEFDKVMDLAGGADNETVSISLRIEGDAPGSMFFMLSPQQADDFITELFKEESGSTELRQSALQELGNIIAGSYLSSLADFTQLDLMPTVPVVVSDMAGAILSAGLIKLSQYYDRAIVIETLLEDKQVDGKMNGHFFLFPDPEFYKVLFRSVGVFNE
ncbi:chemotaxis protein CheC [Halobacillus sp. Marseille-P3879]|uniref:chemotaxis protein CheC n=1 Tax=Halobacillus sp. Marseille-P3879 TaxID=2045014 RepID=UPI000C7D6B53|nr:chemotaxis protein CheC [Halobacillus sp. Marseille-P3879]